jgi:hypothetical protein
MMARITRWRNERCARDPKWHAEKKEYYKDIQRQRMADPTCRAEQNERNKARQKKLRATDPEWRAADIENQRARYAKNREIRRFKIRLRFNSDQEYRKKVYEQHKRSRERNINLRISENLRSRINLAIRLCNTKKSSRTACLIGCTIAELKVHIERQFVKKMSWDDYGRRGWHIDHIRPCASFDLTDPEQQKACFHFTNLRPLWAEINHRKSASRVLLI